MGNPLLLDQEEKKSKAELKEDLDALELQLFRMQENMKEIARKWEVIGIDQAKDDTWVVVYADKREEMFQLMLHACHRPYQGNWNSAIQAEFKDDNTIHIANIKGEENKGFGSVLMTHLKDLARRGNIQYITGDIARRDYDHVNRLKYFYEKHYFDVEIDHDAMCGEIVWYDM